MAIDLKKLKKIMEKNKIIQFDIITHTSLNPATVNRIMNGKQKDILTSGAIEISKYIGCKLEDILMP
ncbi:hypothetical protein COB55_03055 [Candidatus Wolfebacteria bacterium]|nr:MAG: hypothetical protein COB55_03055 [Candidatus Wolfebacteria bacterium]